MDSEYQNVGLDIDGNAEADAPTLPGLGIVDIAGSIAPASTSNSWAITGELGLARSEFDR